MSEVHTRKKAPSIESRVSRLEALTTARSRGADLVSMFLLSGAIFLGLSAAWGGSESSVFSRVQDEPLVSLALAVLLLMVAVASWFGTRAATAVEAKADALRERNAELRKKLAQDLAQGDGSQRPRPPSREPVP